MPYTQAREGRLAAWAACGVPVGWLREGGKASLHVRLRKAVLALSSAHMASVAAFIGLTRRGDIADIASGDAENRPPTDPGATNSKPTSEGDVLRASCHRAHLDDTVRFAFRAHQAAGGFDAAAVAVFEVLRRAAAAAALT